MMATARTEHQPGTGSWDPLIRASAATRLRSATHCSALCKSTKGAQDTPAWQSASRRHRAVAQVRPNRQHHAEVSRIHHHGANWTTVSYAHIRTLWSWEASWRVSRRSVVKRRSGGVALCRSGARVNAASGWSAGAAIAVPVWQDIRASHPNRYRLMLSQGARSNTRFL